MGNTFPEQMAAVTSAHAIVDLIEEGCVKLLSHTETGPQVGMVNNAMLALTHEDAQQPQYSLSVCLCCYEPGLYRLRIFGNALREELQNRNITDIPVANHDHTSTG